MVAPRSSRSQHASVVTRPRSVDEARITRPSSIVSHTPERGSALRFITLPGRLMVSVTFTKRSVAVQNR